MPNANRPSGLSPIGHVTSGSYNGQARIYAIAAADTSAYAIGDPVVSDPLGASAKGPAFVKLAAATGAIRGVIVGVFDTYPGIAKVTNQDSTIRTAGAKTVDWFVMVVDDPFVIFEVQEIGTGIALAMADVGLNTNLVVGTTNGFMSGWMLDNATELATGTLQVRILELVQRADNEVGQYAKWLVKINNHELGNIAVGI